MKNGFIIFVWFLGCIGSVVAGVITFYVTQQPPLPVLEVTTQEQHVAMPKVQLPELEESSGIQTTIETTDARPEIVANFLERHNSPMKPTAEYGKILVEIADTYEIDFRLLPAIAMQESGLCKAIPENSFNCLGFGIHSRGTLRFPSYEAAFNQAAKTLKEKYIDQGRTTPYLIMKKYTPSSNGSWAISVCQWMAEMRYDDRALGKEFKDQCPDVLEYAEEQEATPSADIL